MTSPPPAALARLCSATTTARPLESMNSSRAMSRSMRLTPRCDICANCSSSRGAVPASSAPRRVTTVRPSFSEISIANASADAGNCMVIVSPPLVNTAQDGAPPERQLSDSTGAPFSLGWIRRDYAGGSSSRFFWARATPVLLTSPVSPADEGGGTSGSSGWGTGSMGVGSGTVIRVHVPCVRAAKPAFRSSPGPPTRPCPFRGATCPSPSPRPRQCGRPGPKGPWRAASP